MGSRTAAFVREPATVPAACLPVYRPRFDPGEILEGEIPESFPTGCPLALPFVIPLQAGGFVDRPAARRPVAGAPFRIQPEYQNPLAGEVSITQVGPVSIEDPLGHDPVRLDRAAMRGGRADALRGAPDRGMRVGGGGGSIGAEPCRQTAAASPRRPRVADNSGSVARLLEVADG